MTTDLLAELEASLHFCAICRGRFNAATWDDRHSDNETGEDVHADCCTDCKGGLMRGIGARAMSQNAEYAWVDAPDFIDWINDLIDNSPECCWDQDVDITSIATDYVRYLEGEVVRLGGSLHKEWCFTREAQIDRSGAGNA